MRQKAVEKFKENIRNITRRNNGRSLQETIGELNALLRGTVNYYAKPYTHVLQTLFVWDKWIRHRLRYLKFKRTRLGVKQRRQTSRRWFQRKGLLAMHALALSKNATFPATGTGCGIARCEKFARR